MRKQCEIQILEAYLDRTFDLVAKNTCEFCLCTMKYDCKFMYVITSIELIKDEDDSYPILLDSEYKLYMRVFWPFV